MNNDFETNDTGTQKALTEADIKLAEMDAYLTYMLNALEECLGPASDDVMQMIQDDYDGTIPEGY